MKWEARKFCAKQVRDVQELAQFDGVMLLEQFVLETSMSKQIEKYKFEMQFDGTELYLVTHSTATGKFAG